MTPQSDTLQIYLRYPLRASRAGLFISTGHGHHRERVLDSYELVFVVNGCLELHEDDRVYTVRPNETLLLWPHRHHGPITPFPADLSFYWVHFFVDRQFGSGTNRIVVGSHSRVERPARLKELYNWYIDEQVTESLSPIEASHLLALILCEAARTTGTAGNAPASLATRVDTHISHHFSQSLSTSRIAAHLNYNADYIEKIYRDERGISITEAIQRRRLREARAHLQFSADMNINEIAFACGYSDPAYFRRVFRQEVNMTPKQYRSLYSRIAVNTGGEPLEIR